MALTTDVLEDLGRHVLSFWQVEESSFRNLS